jgi:catechol-2,3-dioxygenase
MNDSAIARLRGIALGARGIVQSARWYEEAWGLLPVQADAQSAYLRGSGREHHVLSLHERAQRGIVRLNFAAESEAAVRALHAKLSERGVTIAAPPQSLAEPGGGFGFDLVDPDRRVLRISSGVAEHERLADRADAPRKITHVVLNTPDLERNLEFYQQMLGFRVSDWSERQMVFIRCNADHHSISLNRADRASLNHIAFEMPDIDALMRGVARLKRHGKPVGWGIGRHGPGNNVFAYFTDPADFVIEYTTEVQQVDDATHEAQVWKRVPELMDRWGTAGPPPPEFRAFMAGQPDPGWQG